MAALSPAANKHKLGSNSKKYVTFSHIPKPLRLRCFSIMSATILEEAAICFFWAGSGFLRAWNILTIAFREKGCE